jgi:Na+/melibiose symporter-like transporter
MGREKKAKQAYPLNFKTKFGVGTMGIAQTIANSLITGFLMLYITDYSGVYTGIAGKAASVATIMLLVGRIWDGINDPLLGFVMDRSPRGNWGKFKPFMFWATLASAILIVALFNIPDGISDLSKVILIYVLYFAFDTAFTLLPMNPLVQSLSNEAVVRTKLLVILRVVTTGVSIVMSFFLVIAIALGGDGITPNIGLAVIVFMVPAALISMFGTALIKEGTGHVNEEQVNFKDFFGVIKENKPLWISTLSGFFGGFTFAFVMAAIIYYIKYAFGAENLGTTSMIWGIIILFGIIIGTFLIQAIQKRVTPGIGAIISNLISIVPLVALWVINLFGPIQNQVILFGLMFIAMIGIGGGFIPGTLINMECMDYNKFKLGKGMEGTINAVGQFIMKIQAAFSSALIGIVLVAVGYDAELYLDATTIPASLFTGLGLVLFALPALFALAAVVVLFFYPLLKKAKRNEVYAMIDAKNVESLGK